MREFHLVGFLDDKLTFAHQMLLNAVDHADDARRRGETPIIPQKPDMGYRAVNALISHDEPVMIQRDATKVQYESELAVIIGKRAKHLSETEALSCVMGYAIGNDSSERNWQRADRTFWRSKNTDTLIVAQLSRAY